MFETFTAVFTLIVFVVPGYVWNTCQSMFVYQDKKLEWEKFAVSLLARSAFLYVPLTPWFWFMWRENWHETFPIYSAFVAINCIFLLPACVGLLHGLEIQLGRLNRLFGALGLQTREKLTPPTAWDTLFGRNLSASWVLVTLTDGRKINGYLGTDSCFSSDVENRDIFLSHTYHVNDQGQMSLVPNTRGVYVSAKEISVLEFIADSNSPQP